MASTNIPSELDSSAMSALARKAAGIESEFNDTQVALSKLESDIIELRKELKGAADFLADAEGDAPDGARAEAGHYYKSACQNLTHEYGDGSTLAESLRKQANRLLELASKVDGIREDLNA